jgi:hypothetical protein
MQIWHLKWWGWGGGSEEVGRILKKIEDNPKQNLSENLSAND